MSQTGITSADYLLATLRNDGSLPAFAELLFLDQITEMASAALGHVAYTTSESSLNQRSSSMMSSNLEVLFPILSLLCHWQSLRFNDASVAEMFYGLKRVNLHVSESGMIEAPLSKLQQNLSIITTAVTPILFSFLDGSVSHRRNLSQRNVPSGSAVGSSSMGGNDTNRPSRNHDVNRDDRHTHDGVDTRRATFTMKNVACQLNNKIRLVVVWAMRFHNRLMMTRDSCWKKFCDVYPALKALYKLSIVSYKFSYLMGFSTHAHPVLAMLGITLVKPGPGSRRITPPTPAAPVIPPGLPVTQKNSFSFGALSVEAKSAFIITVLVSIRVGELLLRLERPNTGTSMGSTISRFFSQRMNRASSSLMNSTVANMVPSGVRDVIPPPEPLKTARGCLIPPPNKTCAICREKQINPCASSSGYVFCYLCLVRFVRDSPTCPISGISCTESDILRLYEDNYEVH